MTQEYRRRPRRTDAEHANVPWPSTHPWGRVDSAWMSHWLTGTGTVELTLYPPGTPRNTRRWADVYGTLVKSQWWMPVVAILTTSARIITGSVATGAIPVAVVTAAFIALTRQLGRKLPREARTLRTRVTAPARDTGRQIDQVLARLEELDASGLDTIDYETRWGQEFRRLTADM